VSARTHLGGLARAALAVLCAAAPALAQQPPEPSCCAGRGVVACRACVKSGCTGARPEDSCSVALGCKGCRGARLEECGKCERPAQVDLEALRAARAAWRAQLQAVDEQLGRELRHAESGHFVLTFGIDRIDTPGAKNAHGAMHVYLDRLERFFDDFRADLGCAEGDFLAKTRVMLWGREPDQVKASVAYARQWSNTEVKLMGANPVVSIFYDKNHLHEEFELHQAVVHQVAHCLLSNVYDGVWPGNIRGGWIDEGSAHYYEQRYFGEVRHYCYVEGDTLGYFEFGRWESAVRSAVARGESPAFLGVAAANTVDMTPEQRMFAWSFCDHVMRVHPGKFGALARSIKQKKPLAEALSGSLGVTPFEFEAAWKAWVLATYSAKPK
jgi:hypothetical protein